MKNKTYQKQIQASKNYRRTRAGRVEVSKANNGIQAFHVYDEAPSSGKSYWDDVVFYSNKKRYLIVWAHPRYAYQSKATTEAFALVDDPEKASDSWFDSFSVVSYAKVGNSRKRVVSYSQDPAYQDTARERYHARVEEAIAQRLASSDIVIRPSIKFSQVGPTTQVTCVWPMEIRDEAELADLVNLVKAVVANKRKVPLDLADTMANYSYDKNSWAAEQSGS